MRRRRTASYLVPVLTAAAGLLATAVATDLSWEQMASRRPLDLVVRATGWLAIAAGSASWARGTRVGLSRLLVLLGVTLFLRDLRELAPPVVRNFGTCTAYTWTAIAAHLALAWPDDVVRGRATRALLTTCYVCAIGTQIMRVLDPVHTVPWARGGSASAGGLALIIVTIVARRWWLRRADDQPTELVLVSIVAVGLIGAWVAFLNLHDTSSPYFDAVPIVVGISVAPIAILSYIRLRAQLSEVQVSRQRTQNALLQVEQSRRRIVQATESERRRIQHDLHDGAQQALAAIQLVLWEAQQAVPATANPQLQITRDKVAEARHQLTHAITELRDLVQGIYPAVLHDHGLLPALEEIARQSPIAIVLDIPKQRWDHEVETTAYFCIKEAIANALKYASASRIDVSAHDKDLSIIIRIQDNGLGQALPPWNGGLRMLQDRVETFGGHIIDHHSTHGSGTQITLQLPHLKVSSPNSATMED